MNLTRWNVIVNSRMASVAKWLRQWLWFHHSRVQVRSPLKLGSANPKKPPLVATCVIRQKKERVIELQVGVILTDTALTSTVFAVVVNCHRHWGLGLPLIQRFNGQLSETSVTKKASSVLRQGAGIISGWQNKAPFLKSPTSDTWGYG